MSKTVIEQAIEALDSTDSEPGSDAWEREKEAMIALEKLAEQPAQQEPVGEIGKIVLFGGQCKEVSWRDGKMPPVGTVLCTSSPNPQAAQQGVDEFDVGWNAARRFYTSPQARPAREPTKAMIDAAERIDWSDSDVRGNIVNMWQAMCAVAPQAQQEPMTAKEIREWWAAENGLEDCDMAKADDFEQVVRAIEARHNIKEKS